MRRGGPPYPRPGGPGGPHGWDGPSGPPHGRGGGPGRAHRRSRGLLRAAILVLLGEQSMHGYQIMAELADRTDGSWRPSAGAVYPTLAQLVAEGLVAISDQHGRKVAALTEAGERYVIEHQRELGAPWEASECVGPEPSDLRKAAEALLATAHHADQVATSAEATAITKELDQARRAIHRILAGEA